LEGVVCWFGYKVDLQHSSPYANRWLEREDKYDIGGHVEDVCDVLVKEIGGVPSIG